MELETQKKQSTVNVALLSAVSFMAYLVCYAGRSLLSPSIPQMVLCGAYTKADLALMGSAFFISYGLGQILNGVIGDRVKARYMVSAGLFFSGICLFLFAFVTSALYGVVLWALCGVLCSMLWAPLSKVVAENMQSDKAKMAMTYLSVASILGSMLSYGLAALSAYMGMWKTGFYIAAAILVSASVLWYAVLLRLERRGCIKPVGKKAAGGASFIDTLRVLVRNAFIPMLIVSVINGILRNAVPFWIPTYMSEFLGTTPAAASALTSIMPLVNLGGTFAGLCIYKWLRNNEYCTTAALFTLSACMFAGAVLLCGVAPALSIAALFISVAAMTSACNIFYSVYCLRFSGTGRISTISGVLNFVSYASAAFASDMFLSLIEKSGWNVTIYSWAIMAVLGALMGLWALLWARQSARLKRI